MPNPKMASATSCTLGFWSLIPSPAVNEDGTKTPATNGAEVLAAARAITKASERPRLKGDPMSVADFLHNLLKEENCLGQGKSEIIWAKLMTTTWLFLRRTVNQCIQRHGD